MNELHDVSRRVQEFLAKVMEVASRPLEEKLKEWLKKVNEYIKNIEDLEEEISSGLDEIEEHILSELDKSKKEILSGIQLLFDYLDEAKKDLELNLAEQKTLLLKLDEKQERVLQKHVLLQKVVENKLSETKEHILSEFAKNKKEILSGIHLLLNSLGQTKKAIEDLEKAISSELSKIEEKTSQKLQLFQKSMENKLSESKEDLEELKAIFKSLKKEIKNENAILNGSVRQVLDRINRMQKFLWAISGLNIMFLVSIIIMVLLLR